MKNKFVLNAFSVLLIAGTIASGMPAWGTSRDREENQGFLTQKGTPKRPGLFEKIGEVCFGSGRSAERNKTVGKICFWSTIGVGVCALGSGGVFLGLYLGGILRGNATSLDISPRGQDFINRLLPYDVSFQYAEDLVGSLSDLNRNACAEKLLELSRVAEQLNNGSLKRQFENIDSLRPEYEDPDEFNCLSEGLAIFTQWQENTEDSRSESLRTAPETTKRTRTKPTTTTQKTTTKPTTTTQKTTTKPATTTQRQNPQSTPNKGGVPSMRDPIAYQNVVRPGQPLLLPEGPMVTLSTGGEARASFLLTDKGGLSRNTYLDQGLYTSARGVYTLPFGTPRDWIEQSATVRYQDGLFNKNILTISTTVVPIHYVYNCPERIWEILMLRADGVYYPTNVYLNSCPPTMPAERLSFYNHPNGVPSVNTYPFQPSVCTYLHNEARGLGWPVQIEIGGLIYAACTVIDSNGGQSTYILNPNGLLAQVRVPFNFVNP